MPDEPTPQKGSFLNINNVSTKGIEKQLTRIADCLEVIVRMQFGYNMTVPKPMQGSSTEVDEVLYSSDHETFVRELEDTLRERKPSEELL